MPNIKNFDFKLIPPRIHSILTLDKLSILQKAESNKIEIPVKNSLENVNLVIGIWTDKIDSLDTDLFSLRVSLPNDDIFNIIEVNTDHKILCNPKYLDDNKFRCLFMVTFDDEDTKLELSLLIYSSSVNKTAITYIYASFIEATYYDEYDANIIKEMIPTLETAQYNKEISNIDYIYTKLTSLGNNKYYLFVSVITNKPDDIFIITSIPLYDKIGPNYYEYYPNSYSEQILSVSVEQLNLEFIRTSNLYISIEALDGEAEITYAKDPFTVYYLKGKGDKLVLISNENLDKIVIKNKGTLNNKFNYNEDPGFVFYISFYIRDSNYNFDKVDFGKSEEIAYRNTDLPIYLFTKINDYCNDIIISVTFKDSETDIIGELSSSPLNVKAIVDKEINIYKAKLNPELISFSNYFVSGPALKAAMVYLPNSTFQNFNIKNKDNPTLLLLLEKENGFTDIKYSKFNIEAQFAKVNDDSIYVENIYYFGKYNGYYINYYRLRKDNNKKYMIIQLSFNSDNLDFSINLEITRYNMTSLIKKAFKERGKIFVFIDTIIIDSEFVYLNIFSKNFSLSPLLNNYVFKYINAKNEEEFIDYKILDNNNTLIIDEKFEVNNKIIQCSFNKIDIDKEKVNITYFFKVIDKKVFIRGAEYETIAIIESPYYTVYQRNPIDDNGTITLIAKVNLPNWIYLQVIAQIEEGASLEYVSYKVIKNEIPEEEKEREEEEEKKEKEDEKDEQKGKERENTSNIVYIVIISIMGFIIAISLLIIIINLITIYQTLFLIILLSIF